MSKYFSRMELTLLLEWNVWEWNTLKILKLAKACLLAQFLNILSRVSLPFNISQIFLFQVFPKRFYSHLILHKLNSKISLYSSQKLMEFLLFVCIFFCFKRFQNVSVVILDICLRYLWIFVYQS